jgi:hypothetical protein
LRLNRGVACSILTKAARRQALAQSDKDRLDQALKTIRDEAQKASSRTLHKVDVATVGQWSAARVLSGELGPRDVQDLSTLDWDGALSTSVSELCGGS